MTIRTTRWDTSSYLRDDQDVALYLEAAFDEAVETGDFSIVADAIGIIAKAKGMTRIARDSGLNRESLYKALSDKGNPSFETIMKVINALGFQIEVKAKAPVQMTSS